MSAVANLLALLVMPIVLPGILNRVKALWAGRRGPPILQLWFDLRRLMRKSSVISSASTPVFRLAPVVVLVTAIAAALVVPLTGSRAVVAFPFDFVWFAYVWTLGRVALVLGALDTGSSFEGMGASREATFATLLEPVLFLVAGALCLHSGARSFEDALVPHIDGGPALVMWFASIIALSIVVQVEAGRIPIDDPSTHLELTMVHEVMILDHSGRDLGFVQLGSAIKLYTGISVVAMLLAPFRSEPGLVAILIHLALCVAITVGLGLIESVVARLKLRVVPQYIVVALAAGGIALLSMIGRGGHG
ncbi:MAG: NADH-quinone oxidoreductase subunit H [Myxococcales bacterium]|nr:NADH-quinone oxidoreductase subunit H [Myxococcales bacterium]